MSSYPILHLLLPDRLPESVQSLAEGGGDQLEQSLSFVQRAAVGQPEREALVLVREARSRLDFEPLPDASPNERHTGHDGYCLIARATGDTMAVFLASQLQAYQEMLEEAIDGGIEMEQEHWHDLRGAFDALMAFVGSARGTAAGDAAPTASAETRGNRDALRRWLLGHHVFMALIQGLIVATNCFASAFQDGDLEQAERSLDLAAVLMQGSASALRFTGEFDGDEYQDFVRPTMMPPNAPAGLSGLWSNDHAYLVKNLARMRKTFKELEGPLAASRDRLAAALESAYGAHRFVCSRFVGDEETSLLMSADSEETAVGVLDNLRAARLRLIQS